MYLIYIERYAPPGVAAPSLEDSGAELQVAAILVSVDAILASVAAIVGVVNLGHYVRSCTDMRQH